VSNARQQSAAPQTNHILHLLLSVVTAGLWLPVWLGVSIANRIRTDRQLPPIDLKGNLLRAGIAMAVIVITLMIGYFTTR